MRSIIFFLAACGFACVATPTRADPSSSGADEAKSVFETLFAAKLKAVAGTADRADDVALAKDMLALAKTSTEQPALLTLLCDSAHDLAAKTADGYATAAEAMTLLAETVEAKRPAAREKLIAVLTKQSSTGKADERDAAGEALIDLLMTMGDEKFEKKQYPEAAADFRRAMTIATQKKSDSLDEAKAKLELAQSRDRTTKKLANLQEKLLKDATDHAAAEEIVKIHVVELDDPAGAKTYLDRIKDAQLKSLVPLAVMPIDQVEEAGLLRLAEWYRAFTSGASATQSVVPLQRARQYLDRFLAVHTARDLDRTKAEAMAKEVEAALSKHAAVTTASTKTTSRSKFPFEVVENQQITDTEKVLLEIVKSEPKLFAKAKRVTPIRQYDAVTLNKREGESKEMTGAAAERVWLVRSGFTGDAVFGPYADIDEGQYVIAWRLGLQEKGSGRAVIITCKYQRQSGEVVEVGQKDVKASQLAPGQWRLVVVPAAFPKNALKSEYVVYTAGLSIAIDRAYVFKIE